MKKKKVWILCTIAVLGALAITGIIQPAISEAKDTLIYVMGAEPTSLDPPNQTDSMSGTAVMTLFDLPIHSKPDGSLEPGLFTRWEHSADGLTWTWHLRKGLKFQDGTPFDAEAVKFNWERCVSTQNKVRRYGLFAPWAQNIRVIDAHTIQTTSEKPFAPILRVLTHASMAFVSPAALKRYGADINRNPVGIGPFRLKEWIPGDHMTLVRDDDYWGPKPTYKTLIFKFVKESSARVMMLETGEADLVLKIPPMDIQLLKDNPDLAVIVKPANRVMGIWLNCRGPLTKNQKFRQALAYAIDRDTIIRHVMKGIATKCCSIIGGGTFGEAKPPCYPYDPKRAKQLLKEAGYKGETLSLWSPQGRYTMDRETGEAIQGYWQEIGLNVKFRVMEWAAYSRGLRLPDDKVKYQAALIGIGASTNDGDMGVREYYHSSSIPKFNRARYSNPDYDRLAEVQSVELDETKRKKIMQKAQEMIMQDLPFIPLHTIDQVIGVRRNLKGLDIMPFERTFVRNAYFGE